MINVSAKLAIDLGVGGEDDLGILVSRSLEMFMQTVYWRLGLESVRES